MKEEEKHLERVWISNGYPLTLMSRSAEPTTHDENIMEADGEAEEKQPMVCIPHVAGLSEDIRRVCRWFGIRTIFKAGSTLRLYLMRVKDSANLNEVQRDVPCSLQL